MPRAVRFDEYGGVDVLHVDEVERPEPGPGQVRVAVVTASINPGEAMIREGAMAEQAPSTFPSGQGSDLAGRIDALGPDVAGWSVGDEVIGWTDERASQAELVVVPCDQLVRKPTQVSWEQAGTLYVAGGTARAMVEAGAVQGGDTVLVSGAAGGVGSIVVQLLTHRGARVLGVAGASNDDWLRSVGVEPVNYGDRLAERLRDAAPDGIDVLLDTFGGGYVDVALGLGVGRIVTIADFAAAEKDGVNLVFGYQSTDADGLAELAGLIADGDLTVPITQVFSLDQVREAYTRLAERHTRGKIVLRVGTDDA